MVAILKTTQIQEPSSATVNLTLDTLGNASFAGMPYGASSFLRNRIINGAMQIWQRGTSFSSPANGAYTADRWILETTSAPASITRVAGPTGYQYAMQITGAAGVTFLQVDQRIESVNCADLVGQNVTISANLSVSSAQTIKWQLLYANATDNFGATTLISSGTWSVGTTAATYSATVSSLPAGSANGLRLDFIANNGGSFTSGTINITGVQLEVGSVATPFERRLYGQELVLCQRYCLVYGGDFNYERIATGQAYTSTQAILTTFLPVEMRVPASLTTSGNFGLSAANAAAQAVTSFSGDNPSKKVFEFIATVASGLVAGNATQLFANNTSAARFILSAEL